MKQKRLCKLCGCCPASVPDRNTMSTRKTVCAECHRERLRDDLRRIMETGRRLPPR